MKFLLFIANEKGFEYLKDFTSYSKEKIGCVVSFRENNVNISYYDKIKTFCENNELVFENWRSIKSNIASLIAHHSITDIVLIGWKFLIPERIKKLLKGEMIVYHDSLLPKFRGFCPTPTAIIKGEKEFGFSIIKAEKEMDTGDILMQKRYPLKEEYYVEDIIKILSKGYSDSIPFLLDGSLKKSFFKKQDEKLATYSCWRDLNDMQIDWSQKNTDIYNFIRALGNPYKGAFTYLDDKKIYIFKSEIIREDKQFELNYPGKFWEINDAEATIICGKGLLKISDCFIENGERLKFNKLRKRFVYKTF